MADSGDPPQRLIDWTGERCVPWTDDIQVVYEHYHRYALAAQFTAGRRVLDLASGEGYGAALLATNAAEVVGVDVDEQTVAHARSRYADTGNLRFEQGSITDPALLADAGHFDVITCFEALEHVLEQRVLMRLVRERLVPGGLFLVSTPDVTVYTHEHGNQNAFHVKELTEDEFRALLGEFFGNVALLRQNVAVGSLLMADQAHAPAMSHTLRRTAEDSWTVTEGSPHTYLVAVASDGPLDAVPAVSTLVDPHRTLVTQARPGHPVSEVAPGPVHVTTSAEPLATIVIPVHGKWDFTRRCLLSIEASRASTPFEVIVVDDASPDESARMLTDCAGVRLVRTERNLGFVGACNLGAGHARGKLLVFLNNDTEVRPGWLDALVETAGTDERIGLVGAKLVYPDGRLQECGGIVWSDGSAANYGHGEDPDDPRFAVVRDVDYCSGAAILVRRRLFERIGGFDERYSPAYYEDTDLAFAVRAAGYRTVVAPDAVVMHHEGVSHGTDPTTGHKRFQEINRAVFTEKWAGALTGQFDGPSPANLWLARQRTRETGLVLVADLQVPTPDKDSGSVRLRRIIETLVELGQRVVFCPMNGGMPQPYTAQLQRAGVTVLPDAARREKFLAEAGGELRLVLLSRPNVAWNLAEQVRIWARHAVVAYDTVDLHFVRLFREADLVTRLGDADAAATLRQRAELYQELELALTRVCDLTLVVSEPERELLTKLAPSADVEVLSNVHSADERAASPAGRAGALFVGSFEHAPNRDAAYWLAGEIWPLVRRKCPEAMLHLVGSDPTGEIRHLAGDGVVFRGWVPDLDPVYGHARVALAPLQFGSGVKGKVGESLAAGVPVVGTSLAFEGMRLRDGEEILVGDTAREIADRIVTLMGDDRLWQRLSDGGRASIAAQFSPQVARATLGRLLSRVR